MSLEKQRIVDLALWETSIGEVNREIPVVIAIQDKEFRTANSIRSHLSFVNEIYSHGWW